MAEMTAAELTALERAITDRLCVDLLPRDPDDWPEWAERAHGQMRHKDDTIDSQAREIAALKKALEKVALGDHLSDWARDVAAAALRNSGGTAT